MYAISRCEVCVQCVWCLCRCELAVWFVLSRQNNSFERILLIPGLGSAYTCCLKELMMIRADKSDACSMEISKSDDLAHHGKIFVPTFVMTQSL